MKRFSIKGYVSMDKKLLLTVKEVAALLGLSERTVWKLSSCGKIPQPARLGRSVRWSRKKLEEFVEQMKMEDSAS